MIMKNFALFCCACALMVTTASCGSQWKISGNEITITKVQTDTIVPAGTLIIQDSVPLP